MAVNLQSHSLKVFRDVRCSLIIQMLLDRSVSLSLSPVIVVLSADDVIDMISCLQVLSTQ